MNAEATGRLICNRRKERGITQKELGDILGVTNTAVSKWERGLSYPDVTLLPALASELNVSVSEIIYGGKDVATDNGESDETAKEVITIADKQIKKNRKKFKIVIVVFSAIIAIVTLAYMTSLLVMALSPCDSTKWKNEVTVKSYFDESSFTLPLKARVGNPAAYYGESFIVIKDTKIKRSKLKEKVKELANKQGLETIEISGDFLIIDNENIGNGYVFAYDRPGGSGNIFFYSAGALLMKNDNYDEGVPIAFPIYLLDEVVYNVVYENLEYHFGYGRAVDEKYIENYVKRFMDFYKAIGGYEVTFNDKKLVATELKTNKTITIVIDVTSSIGTVKITNA